MDCKSLTTKSSGKYFNVGGMKLAASVGYWYGEGAGVPNSVECTTTDWTTPSNGKGFSSSLCVQTGSGAHPTSSPMGIRGPFPRGKARPGRDADHSPPSSAHFKNEWELYLCPQAPPWRVAGQLHFTFVT
jgi:hypothetical protein